MLAPFDFLDKRCGVRVGPLETVRFALLLSGTDAYRAHCFKDSNNKKRKADTGGEDSDTDTDVATDERKQRDNASQMYRQNVALCPVIYFWFTPSVSSVQLRRR